MLFKDLRKQTDQKLIDLCIKGHSPAWDCLVHRYKNLVYHFPNDAGLTSEDADEVFQDTFMSLYKSLERLPQVEVLDQWIATIAKRTTWKMVNRRRRSPEEEINPTYDVEDPDDIPERQMEIKRQQHQIRMGLSQLNDKCKNLIILLFYKYDSTDYDKVAAELGIARGSIGPIRSRCLVKFKKILAGMGITEKSVSRWLD